MFTKLNKKTLEVVQEFFESGFLKKKFIFSF